MAHVLRIALAVLALLTLPAQTALAILEGAGETIEVNGCEDPNSQAIEDPSAEDGFFCLCDAGYIDTKAGEDADCVPDWLLEGDFFLVPVCEIAPEICNQVAEPGNPPQEPDPCKECDLAHQRCMTFEVGTARSNCEQASLDEKIVCLGDEASLCEGAGLSDADFTACIERAAETCHDDFLSELHFCNDTFTRPLELGCNATYIACTVDHCEFEDEGEEDGFDSGFDIGDAGQQIGAVLGSAIDDLQVEPLQMVLVTPVTPEVAPILEAQAPEGPCLHCGSVLALEGTEKTKVGSLGKRREAVEMGLRMTETGLFELMNVDGDVLAGRWERANRKGNKVDFEVFPEFAPFLDAFVRAAARKVGPGVGSANAAGPAVLRMKIKRDGTVALKVRVPFAAEVDGAPKRGRFTAKLEGAPL